METEKYYFRVGVFFLACLAAFAYYVMIFSGDTGNDRLVRHAVYFDNSVTGLIRGAPVKFKGITVGLVHDISFASRDSDRILVLADIADTAPVRSDTVATVGFQGIAGTAFLSLENTHPEEAASPLKKEKDEKFPVIPSKLSDVQSLLADAPEVMGKVTQVVGQAEKLLSDKNVATTEALLPEAHDMLVEATAAFREIKMLARTIREDPSVIIRGPKYSGYEVPKK